MENRYAHVESILAQVFHKDKPMTCPIPLYIYHLCHDYSIPAGRRSAVKSRFFRICVCIALCLFLFSGVFAAMGWGSFLRQVAGTLLYPFTWLADKTAGAVGGFTSYFRDIDDLQAENDSLRDENESLRAALLDAEIVENEDSWLYRYLSMKKEREDWSLLSAYVTATEWAGGRNGQSYAVLLTLNKGSSSGIREGMPVVNQAGLIGIVSEVGVGYSRVRTVLNTDFAAGAIDVRSGETGILEGSFSRLPDGQVVLSAMAAEADAAEGDIVLTSGKGGIYPYGIPIGRISSVSADAYSRTTEAAVTPFTDFTDLHQVVVLTEYVHYTDDSWRTDPAGGEP